MSLDYHRMPAEIFGALAAGGGGAAAIELLRRSQYSKHVLLVCGVAERSPAAYDLLALAQRKDPEAVATVIRHPSVGAWAYHTALALRGEPQVPDATPQWLSNVVAAAAIRASLPAEIEAQVIGGMVTLPSIGAAEVPGAATATVKVAASGTQVRAGNQGVMIPADHHEANPGWRPLRPVLTGPCEIVVDDVDPFRMPTAPHLAAAPDLSRWRPAFADAWTLLRRYHPEMAAEVAGITTVAVPLVTPPHGQVSSSSPDAFGAVAMSEPSDPVRLAVTLAHEVQHMKLSAVLDLVPLIHPDDGSRYYAPWREDPRPAIGLLQGAYAFLAVTGFWRRQRGVPAGGESGDLVADTEFALWRAAVAYVCRALLASQRLTPDGERFVQTMAQTLHRWREEQVPDKAQRLADEEGEQHRARWEVKYGPIPLS